MKKASLNRVNLMSKAWQEQKLGLWVSHRGFRFLGHESSSGGAGEEPTQLVRWKTMVHLRSPPMLMSAFSLFGV